MMKVTVESRKGIIAFQAAIQNAKRTLTDKQFKYNLGAFFASVALQKTLAHIERQDMHWKKLQVEYKHWKSMTGYSTKVYEATGDFKRKLKMKFVRNEWRVGAFREDRHIPSGLNMARIAGILEFGAPEAGIPARPLMRAVSHEMREYVRTFMRSKQFKDLAVRFGDWKNA